MCFTADKKITPLKNNKSGSKHYKANNNEYNSFESFHMFLSMKKNLFSDMNSFAVRTNNKVGVTLLTLPLLHRL